jgi:hypothetical protein
MISLVCPDDRSSALAKAIDRQRLALVDDGGLAVRHRMWRMLAIVAY